MKLTMKEILFDTLLDSVKILPFLFLTYLVMELLEHKTGGKSKDQIRRARWSGPIWGGLLGVIPQCGFSTAASSLYAGRVITVGTLLAVYFSTSDEMLPIMISQAVPVPVMIKILGTKAIIAIISGMVVEVVYTRVLKKQEKEMDIHVVCEEEHCKCEDGIVKSAAKHTIKIFFYLLLISFVLNVIVGIIGEDTLAQFFVGTPVIGELIAALLDKIGLLKKSGAPELIRETAKTELAGQLNLDIDTLLAGADFIATLVDEYGFSDADLEKFAELLFDFTAASEERGERLRLAAAIGALYSYLDEKKAPASLNRYYILKDLDKYIKEPQ